MRAPRVGSLARRQVADLLDVHADTVTRLLPEGLGSAVLAWGGHGREMSFDRGLVERWRAARDCRRGGSGRPCAACALVLEDAEAVAAHLAVERHGVRECAECRPPGALCQPCGLAA